MTDADSELQNIYLEWHDGRRPLSGFIKEIAAWSERREAAAQAQLALNFATQLKNEFMLRALSSDTMPNDYRKMTDEELIAKVYSDITKQLTSDRTGGGEGEA